MKKAVFALPLVASVLVLKYASEHKVQLQDDALGLLADNIFCYTYYFETEKDAEHARDHILSLILRRGEATLQDVYTSYLYNRGVSHRPTDGALSRHGVKNTDWGWTSDRFIFVTHEPCGDWALHLPTPKHL